MRVEDGEGGRRQWHGHAELADREVPLRAEMSSPGGAHGRRGRATWCFIVADDWHRTCHVLGLLRLELGRPPVTEGGLQFLWVVDFPLFEDVDEATGRPIPAHHPFTMPHVDDESLLDGGIDDLLKVRSQAYDLVLNGWELGLGQRPDPSAGRPAADLLAARHLRRRGPAQVRLPARRVPVRGTAARRVRVRHRPAGRAAGRRGEHPRGHRLPQDPDRRRPAHEGAERRSTATNWPSSASACCPAAPEPPSR